MSKLIAADMLKEYARWQVPTVAGGVDTASADRNLLTSAQMEKIQKQAYDEAYARGYREGQAAGQGQIQARVRSLDAMMRTLSQPLERLDDEVEQEFAHLALAIARHIVRREISVDPGQVIAVMREALAILPLAARNVRLHLHPEDAALVRNILSIPAEEHEYKIVEDPVLQRGGCRVMTNTSQIDATLEKRFAAIAAAVLGGERSDDLPEPR